MKKIVIFFLLLSARIFATNYYVSQGGTGNGLSSGTPCSIAQFNAGSVFTETGGDTVYFLGSITSIVIPSRSGTGNGASRLTLNFSGCTLDRGGSGDQLVYCRSINYINYEGGGSWAQGSGVDSVYTPGCVIGTNNSNIVFDFNQGPGNDVTINGFQSIANSSTLGVAVFINGIGVDSLTVSNNYVDNVKGFYGTFGNGNHDILITGNYVRTSQNTTDQTDICSMGSGYNYTIEKNKFINRAPGAGTGGRHNDILQWYANSGGSPYGIIVRYNWLEQQATGTNLTFTQLEDIANNGGTPAIKIYGNVFYAAVPNTADGGVGGGTTGVVWTAYYYQNTYIRKAGVGGGAWGWNGTSSSTLFSKNNIFWASSSFADGSAVASPVATYGKNFAYNWSDFSSTLAGTGGSIVTDPLFTAQASDDYSLGSSSTLRGIADNTIGSEYNQGISFGSTWPNPTLVSRGSSWDVGAYQYASGGATSSSSFTGKVSLTGKVRIN